MGVVGELVFEGGEVFGVEGEGADQAGHVVYGVLAEGEDAFADEASSLGGLACFVGGGGEDPAAGVVLGWGCDCGVVFFGLIH